MVTKVDLYIAHGGKADAGSSNSGNSGGRGGGRFAGRKGKLGVVEETPQQESTMTIAEKKKPKDLKKKSWGGGKEIGTIEEIDQEG